MEIFHVISLILPTLWALISSIHAGLIQLKTKTTQPLAQWVAVASAAVDFGLADGQGRRHPFWKRIAEAASMNQKNHGDLTTELSISW